ncbi:hypothetical protein Pth03_54860 [Planotetraspora thailandica]|uniref:F5/8 type C domain-containing protein n=1 Tax=Planotetraspora thailandica TaxID=487172 RepID=A0A8J3XW11_9ACTN|nr:discoidin domain-containing protein [Planotetraspora thailandica]GII57097.1 hypothetical protein Pth03_54860 [Planotetraspora thailandica]
MRLRVIPALCAAAMATAFFTVPAGAEPLPDAAPAAATGGQPHASYWYPDTILDWDPATDPDARFNRSSVPLQPRTADPALKSNANAHAGEGRVASLVSFAPTSGNPSQGSLDANYYAFGYWQYVDTLVFWGGSASEGLILAPNATVIDAAHRNGVKVYGNVYLPPAAYGGQLQWVRDFVQQSGSAYPVADKMAQVAKYYGFDGWFVNQETGGGDAALATSMREMIKYARAEHPDVDFMWYDSMTEDGAVSWQNALTPANDSFLSDPSPVSNSMFLNFWWSAAGLASSRANAQALGRSEYDLYSGIDTEANGYNTSVNWNALFPAGQPHVTSLGIYRPEWTWKSSTSRADFYARDSRYWVGANGDPSDTTTASSWKGLSTYIAESTPVTSKPFVTGFDTGQGDFYNVEGTRVRTGGWNNLSLQDVLPTYRWIVSSDGTKLKPSIDFGDAYNGGSSLRLTGRLDATNTVRLYETKLPVTRHTKLSVVLKTPAAGPTDLKAAVSFTDAPTEFTTLDLGSTSGNGWEKKTLDLSAYAGRTIAQIGLQASAPTAVDSYDVRIGQIAVYDGPVERPAPPTGLTVDGTTDVSPLRKSLRLSWRPSAHGSVHHYEVYRRNPDGTRTFLGATPNTVYYVPRLDRVGTETKTKIEVLAVSTEFGRSPATPAKVAWSGDVPSEMNLMQDATVTSSSQCAAGEGPDKAVDGNTSTKWCALTADKWLEADLGSVRSLNRFVVDHAETGGESPSWNTVDFTIQVRSSTSDPWTTVATVTGNTAATTTHPASVSARYVRLNITKPTQNSDPAARIYEFEAWGA